MEGGLTRIQGRVLRIQSTLAINQQQGIAVELLTGHCDYGLDYAVSFQLPRCLPPARWIKRATMTVRTISTPKNIQRTLWNAPS